MKRIGIISDTHGDFDTRLRQFLEGVDEIWHAGDIGSIGLADEISSVAPLKAVWGNIDDATTRRSFGEFACFACEEVRVVMTHIGGYPGRYSPAAREMITKERPNLFISGHSHILKVMYDRPHELLHINPGAAGRYGFHKVRTAVRLTIDGSDIRDLEVGEWQK